MAELSPLEKLDAVLNSLEKYRTKDYLTWEKICQIQLHDKTGVDAGEVLSILNKLVKDEYAELVRVNPFDKDEFYERWQIAFEGRVFIEQGGYTQQRANLNAEKIRMDKFDNAQKDFRRSQNMLLSLVALGTLIAAVYYLSQLFGVCK
jgi:hypothetical protein